MPNDPPLQIPIMVVLTLALSASAYFGEAGKPTQSREGNTMRDFWATLCDSIRAENNSAILDCERKRSKLAEKIWRRDTFRAYYTLKHNTKRKTVQRVVRPSLSVGIWCRHLASDNYTPGYHVKADGFSVRDGFGDVVNVPPELFTDVVITPIERYPLRVTQENRPTRTEHRKQFSRKIWRNGEVDTIEDSTSYVEWIDRLVTVASVSNQVSFDYTYTDESEMIGPKDNQVTRKQFREDSCKRWLEPRLDYQGELLPPNSLATCDDGRDIPSLDLDNWKLGADGYILDSVPRYVVKSVLSSFRLNIAAGNAENNGGLRPCYNGKQRSDIRHEFIQECLQEIAVAHLMCLRNISKFTGMLNGGLSRVLTEFVRRYCAGGSNRNRSALIERTKRNANALSQKLAQFAELKFQDATSERVLKLAMEGKTQIEIAEELRKDGKPITQQGVSKRMKETIAFNRVLAQLELDCQTV